MVPAALAIEIMSELICAVILYANLFEAKLKSKRRKAFTWLVTSLMIAMFGEIMTWAVSGRPQFHTVHYWLLVLVTVSSFVVSALWVHYIYLYIKEYKEISFRPFCFILIMEMIFIIVTFVACVKGYLFSIVDNVYVEGDYYWVFLLLNMVTILYVLLLTIFFAKDLGVHDAVAAGGFVFLPMLTVAINIVVPHLSLHYPALALSLLITYIFMQAESETRLMEKERRSKERASHDALTGLLNRREFDETMAQVEHGEGNVGVIYTDVNGLKHTNDNYGHDSGDRLLRLYADILTGMLRKEEIFRVAGDEFVVILPDISEVMLRARADALRKAVGAFNLPVASVGCAFGAKSEIYKIYKEAEKDMYLDKEHFYQEYPDYKR